MTFAESARSYGYQVSAPPTRGGTGLVYRATDLETGREVAIKALAVGFDLDRLEREAQILAEIDHQNVATLRGFHHIDGFGCLATDWVDGHPLSDLVGRNRELRLSRALDIFEQVANALDAVHRAGVVHRDVTPANILIGPDDRASVINFGLSRSTDTATVTVDGTVLGTPRYLAPEVIEGADAGPRSDQYSLAVILHEMVTGRWPFPESGAVAGALHHQLHSQPKPIDEINPLLGAGLADALLRAMSKTPEERFPSIQAFVAAVRDPAAQDLRRWRSEISSPLITAGLPLVLAAILGIVLFSTLRSDDRTAATAEGPATGTTISSSSSGDTTGDGTGETGREADTTIAGTVADTSQPDAPDQLAASDGGQIGRVLNGWPAGLAASLECNLLTDVAFEGPVVARNFFANSTESARIHFVLANDGGVDDTGSMQIGVAGYGQWGEIIEITPGLRYVFSTNAKLDGEISASEMSVYWLNANYIWFDQTASVDVVRTGEGQLLMETGPAPPDARYAVPRLYKDSSEGILIADELVFADVASDCGQFLLG